MTSEVLGREADLAALGGFVDWLRSPGALVLAGAGKTTLLRAGARWRLWAPGGPGNSRAICDCGSIWCAGALRLIAGARMVRQFLTEGWRA